MIADDFHDLTRAQLLALMHRMPRPSASTIALARLDALASHENTAYERWRTASSNAQILTRHAKETGELEAFGGPNFRAAYAAARNAHDRAERLWRRYREIYLQTSRLRRQVSEILQGDAP